MKITHLKFVNSWLDVRKDVSVLAKYFVYDACCAKNYKSCIAYLKKLFSKSDVVHCYGYEIRYYDWSDKFRLYKIVSSGVFKDDGSFYFLNGVQKNISDSEYEKLVEIKRFHEAC